MTSYTTREGLILLVGSVCISKLIAEFHATPQDGHSGAFRTYCCMASNFYWLGMMATIKKFMAACLICQTHKYEAQSPIGLLQSLPIPNSICEDISIDFITGLPRSHRVDCILVVVDRLSKLAHFLNLRHPFTARTMAEVFTREIVRLYGIPKTIVSDWDPVCLCNFWSELSPMQGTQLNSTYHPQMDGQTKVSNR